MKKSNVLLFVAVIFYIIHALIYAQVINLYDIFNDTIVQSIYDFVCTSGIVSGFISAYINYEENKTVAIAFTIISFAMLVIYVMGTLIGSM